MMMSMTEARYPVAEVERWARGLSRRMTLERAARMCNVSAGTVSRWRDGAPLTERTVCAAAVGMAADDAGMVGEFGRVDAGTGRFSARVVVDFVVVELHRPLPVTKRMPRLVHHG